MVFSIPILSKRNSPRLRQTCLQIEHVTNIKTIIAANNNYHTLL